MINLYLFLTFFKIGLFTFGGGYAMIPMIQQDILSHGWLTQQQLIDFIAISESTPGPFAVNIATFVGMSQSGVAGAVCATLGVVLPSFLIILIVAKWFGRIQENIYVKAVFYGLRPAVVALVASAALSIFTAITLGGLSPHALLYFWTLPHISWARHPDRRDRLRGQPLAQKAASHLAHLHLRRAGIRLPRRAAHDSLKEVPHEQEKKPPCRRWSC